MTAAQILRAVGFALLAGAGSFELNVVIAGEGPGSFVAATIASGLVLVLATAGKK